MAQLLVNGVRPSNVIVSNTRAKFVKVNGVVVWADSVYLLGYAGNNDVKVNTGGGANAPDDFALDHKATCGSGDFTNYRYLYIDANVPSWGYDSGGFGYMNVRALGYVGYQDGNGSVIAQQNGKAGESATSRTTYVFDISAVSGTYTVWVGIDVAGGGITGYCNVYNVWLGN